MVAALAEQARGLVDEQGVRSLLAPAGGPDVSGSEVMSSVRRLMAEGE